jgi:hypothetical protein
MIPFRNKISPVLTTLSLLCVALLPGAKAVVPPPDGGYPNLNTAEGQRALFSLTAGAANTAVGAFSLFSVTTGSFNTATGAGSLLFNTADQNTAIGAAALLNNTSGGTIAGVPGSPAEVGPNTAVGTLALGQNTTAGANTAVGYQALAKMTIGNAGLSDGGFNTAVGYKALTSADTSAADVRGTANSALGYQALAYDTTGFGNVAIGHTVLFINTAGNLNTGVGTGALFDCTGNSNTALGNGAGIDATTGDGNVYIGASVFGAAAESNHTYIRNINTTSVGGAGTDTVTVNLTTGLLGHTTSSRRYKQDIQAMDDASQALFALKPVTFRYKKEIDQTQSLEYGLIAEDVAEIDPNLAVRDGTGKIDSVRYSAINAMLLNEFLKEHRKVEQMQKQIETLTAGLQKISARLTAANGAAGKRTDIDRSSPEANMSGSEQVNPSLADSR